MCFPLWRECWILLQWETLFGLQPKPWGILNFLECGERTEFSLAWPGTHSQEPSGWEIMVSASPRVLITLEKNLGDNFWVILLQSIWFSAINGPEISTLLPLASHITINGYTHEYCGARWSEVLVRKNVRLFCFENSFKVPAPSPHLRMWPNRVSGAFQGTVVCTIFVFSVSDFPTRAFMQSLLLPHPKTCSQESANPHLQ